MSKRTMSSQASHELCGTLLLVNFVVDEQHHLDLTKKNKAKRFSLQIVMQWLWKAAHNRKSLLCYRPTKVLGDNGNAVDISVCAAARLP